MFSYSLQINVDIVYMLFIFSWACGIELEDRVVVTGGVGWWDGLPRATVQVYTSEGPQEQLPSLLTSRDGHACAHYLDNQDRVVSITCICNIVTSMINAPHHAYTVLS